MANIIIAGFLFPTAALGQNPEASPGFTLDQNTPNPFNPTTAINFTIPVADHILVYISNADEDPVTTLIDGYMDAGSHSVIWDASGFSAGVYFCTVKFGDLSKTIEMTLLSEEVAVEEETSTIIPEVFTLSQNYPNPFNPITEIAYTVPENSYITLTIFNTLGQKIATLVDRIQEPGNYQVRWNGADFPTGIYFYRLGTEGFAKTMKMLLMK